MQAYKSMGFWVLSPCCSPRTTDSFGDLQVKVVQTVALLEPIHIMLGFVRANLGTTVAQVASRLALVWGVLELFPEYAAFASVNRKLKSVAEREILLTTSRWSPLGPSARFSDT